MRDRSFAPAGAAGVQAIEAAGVAVASVLSAIDTATGKSYQVSSGIALTVIGFATVAALAVVAVGLARLLRWSWMPALLTQLFALIVGIYLLQAHRYDWGVPAVGLAVAAAVALLLPSSMAAYDRRLTGTDGTRSPDPGQNGSRPPAKNGATRTRPPAGRGGPPAGRSGPRAK